MRQGKGATHKPHPVACPELDNNEWALCSGCHRAPTNELFYCLKQRDPLKIFSVNDWEVGTK
eukprot:3568320-Rhodomonas_salina.1